MAGLFVSAGYALILSSVPFLVAWCRSRSVALDVLSDALLIAGNLLIGAGFAMQGNIYGAANFAVAAFVAWSMWRRWKRRWKRRRRDRAPKAVGAKSRALIAALARKVRESARPRPVLRPAPGGAG
jgi:hypothetical protein